MRTLLRLPRAIFAEIDAWLFSAAMNCPGRIGTAWRPSALRRRGATIDPDCVFEVGLFVRGCENLQVGQASGFGRRVSIEKKSGHVKIGNRVSFNEGVVIGADHSRIVIGDNVIVGPGTVFRAANHRIDRTPDILIRDQGHAAAEIVVGSDVWIGANVTVLAGVHIGDHCVIAAGAVVTKDVQSLSVIGGVPARVLRRLERTD